MARGEDYEQRVIFTLDDRASDKVEKVEGKFTRLGSFLRDRFVITLGDVQRGVSAIFGAIQDTITLERQETALRGQLAAIGKDFDSFIGTLKEVSNNTVSTADLIAASSRGLLLGIPAEEIDNLLQIAASRAAATGASVSQAFDDITTGIGRASSEILDNLGFTITLTEVYDQFGATLGKAGKDLTQAEKSQALLNLVLEEGSESAAKFGNSLDDTYTALQQTQAAIEDFTAKGKSLSAVLGTGLAAILTRTAAGFVGFGSIVTLVAAKLTQLAEAIPFIGDRFEGVGEKIRQVSIDLERRFKELNGLANTLSSSADAQASAWLGLSEAQQVVVDSTKAVSEQQSKAAASTQAYIDQLRGLTPELAGADTETKSLAEASDDLTAGFKASGPAADQLRDKVRALKSELGEATTQARAFNAETGGSLSGLTARDRRNQAEVDAALAAGRAPTQGGTRIRTADGSGTRLVGSRDF